MPVSVAGSHAATLLQFVERYMATAAGPHKWPKLVEFLKTAYPRIAADLVQRQQNQVGSRRVARCTYTIAASLQTHGDGWPAIGSKECVWGGR